MLNSSYYLHEKVEESRHNETISFLIVIIGSVFWVGGMLQTLVTVQRPRWFLIFPYQLGSSPYDFVGLAFTLLGVTLFLGGIVLGVHYGAQRLWYSNTLKKSYKLEEEKLKAQTQSNQPKLSATRAKEETAIADNLKSKPDSEKAVKQEA